MRTAIIADIHGNLAALKAVLVDIDAANIDRTIHLGDLVGYGPEPREVVDLVRQKKIAGIIGNHELAILDKRLRDQFTPKAQASLHRTMAMLDDGTRRFFQKMPRHMRVDGFCCVHGCPPDSVSTYLHWLEAPELWEVFKSTRFKLCFVGHSHRLEKVVYHKSGIERASLGPGIFRLDARKRYIINAGSVGQPRDGDIMAKYVIRDESAKTVETRFVAYRITETVEKMVGRGFPVQDIQRLLLGR